MDRLVEYDPLIKENIIDFLQDMSDDDIKYHLDEFLIDHDLHNRSFSSYVPGYRVIILNPSFRFDFPNRFKKFISHTDIFEKKLKSWEYKYYRFEDSSSYGTKYPLERIQFFIKATFDNPRPTYEYIKYYIEKSFRWIFNVTNIDYQTIKIVPKYVQDSSRFHQDELYHLISKIFKNIEIEFEIQSKESEYVIKFDLK